MVDLAVVRRVGEQAFSLLKRDGEMLFHDQIVEVRYEGEGDQGFFVATDRQGRTLRIDRAGGQILPQ